MKKKIVLFAVIALTISGSSFYGGYLYSQSKLPKFQNLPMGQKQIWQMARK